LILVAGSADRVGIRVAALAAALLGLLILASSAPAAAPKAGGVYTGTLVNEDKVQLTVSADGKTARVIVGCLDLGESYPFPRFPIVNGTFDAIISVPGSKTLAQAKLHGRFTSPTQASIVLNEHPDKASSGRYLCFGITSPATLKLQG
jgi:hypothetical protein